MNLTALAFNLASLGIHSHHLTIFWWDNLARHTKTYCGAQRPLRVKA